MNHFFISLVWISLAFISTCLGATKESIDSSQFFLSNTQDAEEYPVINQQEFSFIANTPAFGPLLNSVNVVIEKELEQIGIVHRKKMLVQTDKGEAVDLAGFNTKAFLIYEIRDLLDIDGSSLGIIRASLKLSTNICVGDSETRACIWFANCFLKGEAKKELEKNTSETVHFLMQQFKAHYSKHNQEKPQFNFVLS